MLTFLITILGIKIIFQKMQISIGYLIALREPV